MPGPRTYDFQPAQSGLDAFLSGAGEGYTGITDARRKRQVARQQDEQHRIAMETATQANDRANIEAGVSVQQGVRPDPVTEARQQVTGIRARIGAILGGLTGVTAQPTPTYAHVQKTGPSQAETLANTRESGDDRRLDRSLSSQRELTGMREAGETMRFNDSLAEQRREHDLMHGDRQAELGVQRSHYARSDRQQETRDLHDYGAQLNQEIAGLQREAADKSAILQEGGDMKAYQAHQRDVRTRIGQLRQELQGVNAAMQKRAIGQQLAPQNKTTTTRASSVHHGGGSTF